MRAKKMVGLARVVLTRREHVVMLEPFEKGLLATTLRYPYEVRDVADYFEDIPDLKLPDEMMTLAAHIVDTKAGHFDPKTFEDHYEKALVELLKSKEAGRPVETVGEEEAAPRVINLMDALKASINASGKKPAAASTGARRPAAKKKAGAR
jgi:DNA end-binding protein Ku